MKKTDRRQFLALTEVDRAILDSYCAAAECLGTCLGESTEIVIHSFGTDDRFTRCVVNSASDPDCRGANHMIPEPLFHTLEQLSIRHSRGELPIAETFVVCPDGRKCKFTSIGILSGDRLIGAMVINFGLNIPFNEVVQRFVFPSEAEQSALPLQVNEAGGYSAAIKQEILRVKDAVMSDSSIPAKYKRKEIIRRLNSAGVFKVKSAIQVCADMLGVTVATIYMHVRNQASG